MDSQVRTAGTAEIGVTGLAVMGSNLARNFAAKGFVTAIHNRSAARTTALIAAHGADGAFVPSTSAADFVGSLATPRKIVIMVKAGGPTDAVIDELAGLLEPGDILIDGGNAKFQDTLRREAALRDRGIHFVGCGISGGPPGARNSPLPLALARIIAVSAMAISCTLAFCSLMECVAIEVCISSPSSSLRRFLISVISASAQVTSRWFDPGCEIRYCIQSVAASIHEGFIEEDLKIVCYTDHQIFQRYHKYRVKQAYNKSKALTLKNTSRVATRRLCYTY